MPFTASANQTPSAPPNRTHDQGLGQRVCDCQLPMRLIGVKRSRLSLGSHRRSDKKFNCASWPGPSFVFVSVMVGQDLISFLYERWFGRGTTFDSGFKHI